MANVSSSSSSGVGFTGLLAVLFIALKLLGYIKWPWLWVLAPLWLGLLLWVFVFSLIILVAIAQSGRR